MTLKESGKNNPSSLSQEKSNPSSSSKLEEKIKKIISAGVIAAAMFGLANQFLDSQQTTAYASEPFPNLPPITQEQLPQKENTFPKVIIQQNNPEKITSQNEISTEQIFGQLIESIEEVEEKDIDDISDIYLKTSPSGDLEEILLSIKFKSDSEEPFRYYWIFESTKKNSQFLPFYYISQIPPEVGTDIGYHFSLIKRANGEISVAGNGFRTENLPFRYATLKDGNWIQEKVPLDNTGNPIEQIELGDITLVAVDGYNFRRGSFFVRYGQDNFKRVIWSEELPKQLIYPYVAKRFGNKVVIYSGSLVDGKYGKIVIPNIYQPDQNVTAQLFFVGGSIDGIDALWNEQTQDTELVVVNSGGIDTLTILNKEGQVLWLYRYGPQSVCSVKFLDSNTLLAAFQESSIVVLKTIEFNIVQQTVNIIGTREIKFTGLNTYTPIRNIINTFSIENKKYAILPIWNQRVIPNPEQPDSPYYISFSSLVIVEIKPDRTLGEYHLITKGLNRPEFKVFLPVVSK